MNTKRKVFEALSKEIKKVDLSAKSDLEQAIGMHTPDDMNFGEVAGLNYSGKEFENSLKNLQHVTQPFVDTYEYIERNYGDMSNSIKALEDAMVVFGRALSDVGMDRFDSPTYSHANEGYEDLIRLSEQATDYLAIYADAYAIAKKII